MNLLYPRLSRRQFGWMAVFGLVGAVIAGGYGVIHDQITFSMGPEYFTRFKFDQFNYLDKGGPDRLIVAKIGFLATWWVGLFAGWFMGRVTLPHLPLAVAARRSAKGVAIMLIAAMAFAGVASLLAPKTLSDERMPGWQGMLDMFGVTDGLAFVQVGYIHNASYLGGLVGLIAALIWLRLSRGHDGGDPDPIELKAP